MTSALSPPALEMNGVVKNYNALRPLRIATFTLADGERASLGGMAAGVSELLVNLITGASLPDGGEIRVFGRSTAAISEGDAWLVWLEQFGIVSPRGVLLEGSTLEQNLAMPYTLQIDPVPADVAARVQTLALECGIEPDRWLRRAAGELPPDVRVLAHLARALALDPRFVIVEHPTADVAADALAGLAGAIRRACDARGLTTLVLTNDEEFGRAVAPRNLRIEGATGVLKPVRRGWLGR